MISSFRVLAVVGILALASAGCGKGNQTGADAGKKKMESKSAALKSGDMKSKSSKSGTKLEAASTMKHEKTQSAPRRVGVLTVEDNGRDIELRPGQVITVVLEANHSTGMSWVLREPSGIVVVREGNPVYAAKAGKGSSTETWHFRAARPGNQTVRLEYRRKFAQNVPERTFGFTASVR